MITNVKLYGLVLAGGKSTRMGEDKGIIPYHGIPQRDYLYQILDKTCEAAYMSVRADQLEGISSDRNIIVDDDEFRGPYNGLLSAHSKFPDVAWLVLACDLPLMNEEAILELIKHRDDSMMATAFANPENPLPEPLCAIWESGALKKSIAYLEEGNGTCPRKFLINNNVRLVFPEHAEVLLNANSKSEYEEALLKITHE